MMNKKHDYLPVSNWLLIKEIVSVKERSVEPAFLFVFISLWLKNNNFISERLFLFNNVRLCTRVWYFDLFTLMMIVGGVVLSSGKLWFITILVCLILI